MKGYLIFVVCVASFLSLSQSYTIRRHKTSSDNNKNKAFAEMDGYRPFVTRPRYGYGKRSEESAELYDVLKDISNEDFKNEATYIILDEDEGSDDDNESEDEQIPIIAIKSRRLLRKFGKDENNIITESLDGGSPIIVKRQRGRWGRFGKRSSDSEDKPSRWGRFGKRNIESEDKPSRWGRFGKRNIESEDKSPRWGRFGRNSASNDKPSRWGRFGKRDIASNDKPSRWGRFGDEIMEEEERDSEENNPAKSRWGRFGKRTVKMILLDDEDTNNDH